MLFSKDKIVFNFRFALIISILTISVICRAQYRPHFSQYMFNGLSLNPAYAGSEEVFNVAAIYRTSALGKSVDGAPVTQAFACDFPMQNPNLAIGLLVFNDKASLLRQSGAYFAYCYRVQAGEGNLSFGMNVGFDLFNENYSKISIIDQNDPVFLENKTSFMPNVGVGAYYYMSNFFAGLSIPYIMKYTNQLNQPQKVSPTFSNTVIYCGTIIPAGNDLKFKPSVLFHYSGTGILIDLNSNFLFLKERLELGASWRSNHIIVGMAQFRINQFRIGYAYDHALRKQSIINSTHEIMLRYDLNIVVKAANPIFF